jgi:3-oxoadipate enol-lactonase
MPIAELDGLRLNWREDGDPEGRPVVLAGALGTDLQVWDRLVERLGQGLRVIRYDARGHGLSDCPPGPYTMGALVRDAERLIEHLGAAGAVFVGLSVGGLVAQGLSVKRPDLVSALVLACTAARLGSPESWAARTAALRAGGMAAIAPAVLERWFARRDPAAPELRGVRDMLLRCPAEGYAATCAAIAGADFRATTPTLSLPVLVLAGDGDASTPPDLVRETAETIVGARFAMIRGAGHLPCVDTPETMARHIAAFIATLPELR